MARVVLVVLIASLPWAGALAQPEAAVVPPAGERPAGPKPPGPPPHEWEKARRAPDKRPPQDDEEGALKRFKKRFQEMSPEEREHFRQNFQRWREMPEGEKQHWKDRAKAVHSRMAKAVDEAIASTGLNLTKDQREVFALRYRQERCRVEEKLRKEYDARRDEEMKGVVERLKREFTSAPTPTPAPAP